MVPDKVWPLHITQIKFEDHTSKGVMQQKSHSSGERNQGVEGKEKKGGKMCVSIKWASCSPFQQLKGADIYTKRNV